MSGIIPGDKKVPKGIGRYDDRLTIRNKIWWWGHRQREQWSHAWLTIWCAWVGHKPQEKMNATICRRCRIVLRHR